MDNPPTNPGRRLCAHANDDTPMHWLEPGETCPHQPPAVHIVPDPSPHPAAGCTCPVCHLEALRTTYPGWHINPAPWGGYRAEWKSESGLSIRYVGATTLADMHKRLEVIESARGESDE